MKTGYFDAVLSDEGQPISATVTIFLAGTETLAVIWADFQGLVQKDNPFQTDSLGRFKFYADPGLYDIKISGTGITTYTLEDVVLAYNIPWEDVREYASFAAAVTAIGGAEKTLLVPNEQAVSADITVPANINLYFIKGGSLNIGSGYTVTIEGHVAAGLFQIFKGPGTAEISRGLVFKHWWTGDVAVTLPSSTGWLQSHMRFAKKMVSQENEFAFAVQANIPQDTEAPASYEKVSFFSMIKTSDPSGATQRDAVGMDGRGYIGEANASGRAWGMLAMAMILAGGEGMLCGHEIDVRNLGASQPLVGTTTSKYGLQVVTIDNPATAAVYINRQGASTWHKGVYADPAVLAAGASFLELLGLFSVDKAGDLLCQAIKFGLESLTISGGVITVSKTDVKVDTEAAAATDDLDTINGGAAGDVIILRTVDSLRDVTVKHLTGNIHLMGADKVLLDRYYRLTLMHDGTYWVMVSKNF